MSPRIVDGEIVSHLDLGKHPVDGELVVVFTQRAGYVVLVIAGLIFFSQHGDMMVCAVHGGTHQVYSAGVAAQVFLMGMLFMNHLCDQMSVGSHHETAQLGVDCHVSHTCRDENFLISMLHAVRDFIDIVCFLIRAVGDPDAAGQVDEADIRAGLFLQLHGQLKQLLRQHGIIGVGHRIARQEGVNAEMLHAFFLQNAEALEHLLRGEAVLGISGVVHDAVADLEHAAGIITAA